MISQASFSNFEVRRVGLRQHQVGGSFQGNLTPGIGGWPTAYKDVASMEVECEARRGDRATRERSYVILQTLSVHEKVKWLCLWVNEQSDDWYEIAPESFRVRLLGIAGHDSLFGSWMDIPK